MKNAVKLLPLILLCACAGGPDIVRYEAEKASHALAKQCADGWFQAKPFTQQDVDLVYKALADWAARLQVDAAALGAK